MLIHGKDSLRAKSTCYIMAYFMSKLREAFRQRVGCSLLSVLCSDWPSHKEAMQKRDSSACMLNGRMGSHADMMVSINAEHLPIMDTQPQSLLESLLLHRTCR